MKRIVLALICAASMTAMEAKTLVAYFSATGTTKLAAVQLAKQHNARLWGICPRIINSWLDNNLPQLEGKTLIPFATSGSSGIEEAETYLKQTYPTLNWQKGMLLNKWK